jgi:AAA domain-containing protein
LVREHNLAKPFVVVLDEAQNLAEPTLESLRVLTNVETSREKLLHIVLSGHPRLAERLASPHLIQLRQRVSIFARLEPFNAEEIHLYIDHRLRVAGYDFARPLFTASALDLIALSTLGVPRNINNVCFNALSLGFVKRQETIDVDVIREVLQDLDLQALIEVGGEVPFVSKSAASDHDVSGERLEPSTSVLAFLSAAPAEPGSSTPRNGGEAQTAVPASRPPRDVDQRRSSRVEQPVPLVAVGTDRSGESFEEHTSSVSLNLHGCRYASRHDYPVGGWITLRVTGRDGADSSVARACVRSVFPSKSPGELCEVGVELETPANVWGVAAPPDDWQFSVMSSDFGDGAAAAVAPALDPSASAASSLQESPLSPVDGRAEVTSSPSPAPVSEVHDLAMDTEVLAFEQLLPTLQDKLQQAADRVAQTAIESRLDEFATNASTRIDQAWKANMRQAEEFFAARQAELQEQREKDLTYRSRAEETAQRMDILAAKAGQGLLVLQKFVARIKNEMEPQFEATLNGSLDRANAEFQAMSAKVSDRLAQAEETIQATLRDVRSLLAAPPAHDSEERLESLVNSSRAEILNHIAERLADQRSQFEQKQNVVRQRADEFAQQLERLTAGLRQVQAQQEQSNAEVRSLSTLSNSGLSQEHLDSLMHSSREQIFNHLEGRLGEISTRFDQQQELTRRHIEEATQRLGNLAAETREVSSRHEQSLAELGSLVAAAKSNASQERLDGLLNSARDQFSNHLESRLREISTRFDQQHDAVGQSCAEITQRLEQLATDTRTQLGAARELAERSHRELFPQNLGALEQSADRAKMDIENLAARVFDRQLIRMTEQRQAVARELSLELEARASQTRALLEKAANSALDQFRRRIELQIDLTIADATQRVTSTLASLEAEYRTAREEHRRAMENEVARAAEQAKMEFRSGMKAFLYSCLVAAVGAVDQHAQSTLSGLSNDPGGSSFRLDTPTDSSAKSEDLSSSTRVSPSTQDPLR